MVLRLAIAAVATAVIVVLASRKPVRPPAWMDSGRYGWFLFGLFFVLYVAIKFNRHWTLNSFGFDLSAFDYAFYNTFQGKFLYTPFFGKNYLQEHFFPAMIMFLPFYRIHPSPETLLVLQALVVSLTAVPFFSLARHVTRDNIAAAVFTAALMMNPYMLRGVAFDFHVEMLRPLLLACLFLGYVKNRRALFYPALVLLIFTKETEWVSGLAVGAVLWMVSRRRAFAVPAVAISLATGLFIYLLVNPYFSISDDYYLRRYGHYGGNIPQILMHWLTHPWVFFSPGVLKQAVKILLPVLFLPALSPLALAALPGFYIHMLSIKLQQQTLALYYGSGVVTILFIAALSGYARLQAKNLRWPPALLLPAMLILNAGYVRFLPVTPAHREVIALARSIEPGSSVAADNEIIPHLKRQKKILCTNFAGGRTGEFQYCYFQGNKYGELKAEITGGQNFDLAGTAGGYELYRRKAEAVQAGPEEKVK